MILDKALLVKGAVGAASVAGLGGVVVFRKELGIVKSSKAGTQQNTSGPQVPDGTSSGEGVSVTDRTVNSLTSNTQESQVDALGIPNKCTAAGSSSPCDLTADDLKKIKFEGLGEEGTEVTVEGFPTEDGRKVTLTIETSGTKKYKFNNSGSQITIKKGNDQSKTVVLEAGDNEFTEENNALKKVEVVQPQSPVAVSQTKTTTDALGIPNKCTSSSSCQLTVDDLKGIKFQAYDETGTVTLEPANPDPSNQITLKIGSSTPKIYTFNNSGSKLTLKRGSGTNNSVILDAGDTEFTEEEGKLKPYEESSFTTVNNTLGTLKFPNKCKFKSSDKNNKTKDCSVTEEELKNIEFENKESALTITGANGNINLKIRILKKTEDQSEYDSTIKDNDLRIIFKDTTSKITIKGKPNNDIIIPTGSNMELRVNAANKLSKPFTTLNTLPTTWKITCTDNNNECSSESSLKIFSGSNLSECQEVKISDTSQNIFTVAKDTDNYNLGYKFTVKANTSASPSLTSGDSYEIRYMTGKGWGFVKKNPS